MPIQKRPATVQVAAVAQKRQAVRRSVQIQVFGVDGRTLELKLDSEDDIARVKQVIAKKWGIPPSCQKLVHDITLAQDSHRLGRYCRDKDDTVKLSYVLTLDDVCKQLGRKINASVKLQALEDLRKLGQRGANTISSVCGCLNDASPEIRKSALATLKKISADQRCTVDIIIASYAEWVSITAPCYAGKTEWAAKILRTIAENENGYAVTSIVRMIGSLSGHAKEWCADVLRRIAQEPFHAADLLLSELLQKDASLKPDDAFEVEEVIDNFVYSASTKNISTKGMSLYIVAALNRYLEAPDENTQQNALLILPRLGHECFTEERPTKWSQEVQDHYCKLITTIADVMGTHASSRKMVELALDALARLVLKHDGELTGRIVTLLDISGEERVNCLALKVLRKCTDRGNKPAITAASALLTSNSNKVKMVAMKTLSKLVDYRLNHYDDDSYSYFSDADFDD
eukprot:TRINITY_DN72687_c0_g1_i1.p1 TRINITY_DN72687_c0_g1~~TRINITY_DN72687_c0_g1_i1.p1  ORF type:complete len:459 (-),score=79.77 TRINITY_DN72687_c0_g1_i1:129-1505(-)